MLHETVHVVGPARLDHDLPREDYCFDVILSLLPPSDIR